MSSEGSSEARCERCGHSVPLTDVGANGWVGFGPNCGQKIRLMSGAKCESCGHSVPLKSSYPALAGGAIVLIVIGTACFGNVAVASFPVPLLITALTVGRGSLLREVSVRVSIDVCRNRRSGRGPPTPSVAAPVASGRGAPVIVSQPLPASPSRLATAELSNLPRPLTIPGPRASQEGNTSELISCAVRRHESVGPVAYDRLTSDRVTK
jgi:DNA-directed RNA polymerase subunit RPC12/RpoP